MTSQIYWVVPREAKVVKEIHITSSYTDLTIVQSNTLFQGALNGFLRTALARVHRRQRSRSSDNRDSSIEYRVCVSHSAEGEHALISRAHSVPQLRLELGRQGKQVRIRTGQASRTADVGRWEEGEDGGEEDHGSHAAVHDNLRGQEGIQAGRCGRNR